MTKVAVFLAAALLVLVGIAYWMSSRLNGETLPPKDASSAAQASFTCALPVITTSSTGNPSLGFKINAGFVNIPTGEFWVDPAAALQDLPRIPAARTPLPTHPHSSDGCPPTVEPSHLMGARTYTSSGYR